MSRRGEPMLTYSGIVFYPLDPRPEDILVADIAHHLSMLCRFNGALDCFYSVGEHSVRVAAEVALRGSVPEALWGLLHDASEAYLNDIIRPVKHEPEMEAYRTIEKQIMDAVVQRFGLAPLEPPLVKAIDRRICMTESLQLRPKHIRRHAPMMEHKEGYEPLDITIQPMASWQVESAFLEAFAQYGGR